MTMCGHLHRTVVTLGKRIVEVDVEAQVKQLDIHYSEDSSCQSGDTELENLTPLGMKEDLDLRVSL